MLEKTKSFFNKVISTLSCCLKPAADVTADQTRELSALQAMTRQVGDCVDIASGEESGLAEESQQITAYHTGEASTSQTLPVARPQPKLSLFHSLLQQQITGPCEQQKESFIVSSLAKRFIPGSPEFSLCEEYVRVIGFREKCGKGLLPTELDEFKFLSLCPSLTWSRWLFRETSKHKTGAEYAEIRFCLGEILKFSNESLYSGVFLHSLLRDLVFEGTKRAFSFEPTLESVWQVLLNGKILSPTQERYHAFRLRDLLGELGYWEKRIMAAALHIGAVTLRAHVGLPPKPQIVPIEVFLPFYIDGLMLEAQAQETSQIPLSGSQGRLLIASVFEPMTLEGILVVIGGFLTFAVAFFFLCRWVWSIRSSLIPRYNKVGIEDSNLEKVEELREPMPEPRKLGNELTLMQERKRSDFH